MPPPRLAVALVWTVLGTHGQVEDVGRSSLAPYTCRASLAGGRYKVHWAIDEGDCGGGASSPAAGAWEAGSRSKRSARALLHDGPPVNASVEDTVACREAVLRVALTLELRGASAVSARQSGWWVVFGFSATGSIIGADLVRYDSKARRVVDGHTRGSPIMARDDHQDWFLDGPVNASLVTVPHAAAGPGVGISNTNNNKVMRATVRLRRALWSADVHYDLDPAPYPAKRHVLTHVVGQWGLGHYPHPEESTGLGDGTGGPSPPLTHTEWQPPPGQDQHAQGGGGGTGGGGIP
mmetsp:Transcript_9689/g.28639  ORF Transcript_9689/g.28639 Transcript_9689/m.28639 type:complete len:293 (+) Transcript_9689:13-891(+)